MYPFVKWCMTLCWPYLVPLKIRCELVHYFAIFSILKVMGCDGEESVSEKAEGTTASLANFAIRSACIQELTHSGDVGLEKGSPGGACCKWSWRSRESGALNRREDGKSSSVRIMRGSGVFQDIRE